MVPMSTHVAISATHLTKRYGQFEAVRSIDFAVDAGQCVGFLGPNGAGKTTTVKMVAGISPITSGEVFVLGLNVRRRPREVKARLGVCPQEENLDPDFTVLKNLLVFARYFGIPRAMAKSRAFRLLEFLHLEDKAHARIDELSGGMKRRLLLARALINEPSILLLDEPTTGLDPQARHVIWNKVLDLKSRGVTILLTTHYMEEASFLCDRVILMDEGRIVQEGAPGSMVAEHVGREVVEVWDPSPDLLNTILAHHWPHELLDDRVLVRDRTGGVVYRILEQAFPHHRRLVRPATLEDVFLMLTGRQLRE